MHLFWLLDPSSTDESEPAATLPFSAVAVNADGWTLSATIGASKDGGTYTGLNNYSATGLALTVTSRSWTTGGVETTIQRTVIATAVKRKAYNQQAVLEETEDGADLDVIFALSSFIYADDTVTCAVAEGFYTDNGTGGSGLENSAQTPAVTNNSTKDYPQPGAVWLQHDREWVKANSYSPKLAVMHRFAQAGQPVRAVKFTATDEHSHSTSAFATSLSSGNWSASGLYANYYTAALDFTALDQGDLITIDAVIYPWVGDAFTISVDAETYPSPNLTVIKALNDRTGAYGTVYGYVDGVGGGTPAVSTNAVTAAGTPYASIAAAAAAIQTYNNANFSRNEIAGGIIRIAAGVTLTGLGNNNLTSMNDGDIPLQVEGVDQATSIYTTDGAYGNCIINSMLKLKNLTIQKASGSTIMFDGENSVACMLICEDVDFDLNGNSRYDALFYQVGREYMINCTGDDCGQGGPNGTDPQSIVLALGTSFPTLASGLKIYNAVASRLAEINAYAVNLGDAKGGFFGWNVFSGANTSNSAFIARAGGSTTFGPRGCMIVGNLFEKYHASGTPTALDIEMQDTATDDVNIIEACNTAVGARSNLLYNEDGAGIKEGLSKHSVHYRWNCKGDVFGTNGAYINNWPIIYKVDSGFNHIDAGDDNGATSPGVGAWLGEIAARGEITNGTPDFTNDKSALGAGGGGGDYGPGGSSTIPLIPAGLTMFAVDLFGAAIPTNGTAFAGAVQ